MDGSQYLQPSGQAAAAPKGVSSGVDLMLEELAGLNNRLDGSGGLLTSISDRWFGAQPPAQTPHTPPQIPRALNEMPPRLTRLEQLIRDGHGLAARIEQQLERLRQL